MMGMKDSNFRIVEVQGGNTREKNRVCIDRLDSERCTGIGILVPGKSSWHDSKESLDMGCYTVLNMRKIAMDTSDDANVLSIINKLNLGLVDRDWVDSLAVGNKMLLV